MSNTVDLQYVFDNICKLHQFDRGAFENLKEDTSLDVAIKIMARFCMTLGEALEAIEIGLNKDHAEMIWKACHKIAGTSELLGFITLGKRSKELSKSLQALPDLSAHFVDLQKYQDQLSKVRQEIEKVIPNWKQYL